MAISEAEKIGRIWSEKISRETKWFDMPLVIEHLAAKFDYPYSHGMHFMDPFLCRLAGAGTFDRAISIGCGIASTEAKLLKMGTVRHFDLFDLSSVRLARARKQYERDGLLNRAELFVSDAFATDPVERYDLIYWKDALHHMMSAMQAVEWSWRALKSGGTFALWDFVGPSRFQWSDENLRVVNEFRAHLPDRFFPGSKDRRIRRKSVEEMIELDPSEAADSSGIILAVKRFFSGAEVIPLGGAVFHFGFRGIIERLLADKEGQRFVQDALALDDSLLEESHFAACIVEK